MAFKKFSNYLEQKQGKFFLLRDDGDYADVVFLYQNYDDMMVCDVHYLKTAGYSGYVECCSEEYGHCPACSYGNNGIRKDSKLFIPLFNLSKNAVEFWDRNTSFENVINTYVFKNFPNPSEFVFRITRHGAARDRNTRYEITALGRNSNYPYEKILADYNMSFPEGYSEVCNSMTPEEMSSYLNNGSNPNDLGDYTYTPVPRSASNSDSSTEVPEPPQIDVPTPSYSAPPTDLPEIDTNPATVAPSAVEAPVAPETSVTADSDDDIDDVNF